MSGFTRYVFGQLSVGMILVTCGLVAIIWLTQSLRFVEMIINRGLSAGDFVYLTGLLLPNFIVVILPIAIFTIVLFTYSKLITDRELVIMRAAGQSQPALAKPALLLGLVVVLLSYALNLYLVPESYRAFRDLQWDIRHSFSQVLLKEGAFTDLSATTTVYVRERSTDGQLHGVLVHDKGGSELPFTLMAERGALLDSERGARVVLFDGNRQEIDPKTKKLSILYFDRWVYDLGVGGPAQTRYREARERPLEELLNAADDTSISAVDVGKFTVEAHKRLATPFLCLTFVLIGLASILSGDFSRRGQTPRVLSAVGCMVGLQGAVLGAENVIAKNLDLIPLLYGLIILPMIPALLIMMGIHKSGRKPGPSDGDEREPGPVTAMGGT